MPIEYQLNAPISAQQYIALLQHSSLGDRRPLNDDACIQGMLENSNLCVSAWLGERLVGLARSLSDFNYVCYLADLVVHQDYQHNGIGKQLQQHTQAQLGERCKLVLLAASTANDYYPQLGYQSNPRGWVLARDQAL